VTGLPVTTIVDAEVDGAHLDVRIVGARIEAVGPDLSRTGSRIVDAGGGALLPGLHDHHIHLLALAARNRSVDATDLADASAFDDALAGAAHGSPWLRVVGYDERHGPLDAARLDALAPGRPVRVQHRTGAAWMLSSAGSRLAGRESDAGWWHRDDEALRDAWPDDPPPDLATVSRSLAACGVTGVTDATPFGTTGGFDLLAAARADGSLAQRVVVTGGPALTAVDPPHGLERGPVKIVVGDHELPDPDVLAGRIVAAHRAGRAVAVHCVTRVALVLALVAWEAAGAVDGDRIEHGSIVPVELIARVAGLGLHVVTQPAFVRQRGDAYLRDLEPDDVPHLYRCGSLLAAGVGVGLSTDAPYGPADPWVAIATAADRRTATGAVVGADETVSTGRALDAFLSSPDRPGGPPRRVAPGAAADLVLLDVPLVVALADPSADHVATTMISGAD